MRACSIVELADSLFLNLDVGRLLSACDYILDVAGLSLPSTVRYDAEVLSFPLESLCSSLPEHLWRRLEVISERHRDFLL